MERAPKMTKMTKRLAHTSRRPIPVLMSALMSAVVGVGLLMTSPLFAGDRYPVEIQGSSKGGERFAMMFAASIPDRPVRDTEDGSSPSAKMANGQLFTSKHQTPLDLTWDFGDGTVVTIHDRTSVSHQYVDDGHYKVTLVVRDAVGEFARATRDVSVSNTDPISIDVAATVIDPAQALVELTGWAEDVSGDPLHFHWNFGDGDSAEGMQDEIWWTQHQYAAPGRYTVTLTVSDDDYPWSSGSERNDGRAVKTIEVTVGDGGTPPPGPNQPNADSTETALTNSLKITSNGVVNSQFSAEVRPFAGLYLSRVNPGVCRFMFSVRDNANLVQGMAVLDLHGIPPKGGKFRINQPRFALTFQPDAETYLAATTTQLDIFGDTGVAGLVQRKLDEVKQPNGDPLTDEQRRAATDRLFDVSGIRSQPRSGGNAVAPAAASPLVDKQIGFRTVRGTLALDFIPGDRAVGHFDVTMEAGFGPFKGQTIDVTADLALDLEAAASDGIVRYDGCEPAPFEIKKVWPDDGYQHLRSRQPNVEVTFSERVDPATLNAQTVQIAYMDTSETLVPVPVHIMRDDRSVHAIPVQPLLPGVIYTVRVKTGDDGVRSRAGSPLTGTKGSDWSSSQFTTRIDMTPQTDDGRLLACNLYQPARDVPLIVGKPAAARVFASWEPQPGVHRNHQVKDFIGTVELYGTDNTVVATTLHTFVRPDRWKARGISLPSAEQSAQLRFTPGADTSRSLLAAIKVNTSPRLNPDIQYTANCPLTLWDREPTLSIDFFALRFDEWKDHPERLDAMMPTLQRIADASVDYAMQQFPFASITASPVRIVEPDIDIPPLHPENAPADFECRAGCVLGGVQTLHRTFAGYVYDGTRYPGIAGWLHEQSKADVIVVLGPEDRLMGGETVATLLDGQGLALVLGGDSATYFPRFVNGAVHEIGHMLCLDHLPFVNGDAERELVLPLRNGKAFTYKGIEAMRISRDGQTLWNKSSTDGNEQGNRLFQLMFPGTIPTDDAFIANHHYRRIQKLLDRIGPSQGSKLPLECKFLDGEP